MLTVAVLGICFAAASVSADYFCTQTLYKSRVAEQELYSSLNADPHASYNGYTVEQLGEGYEKPSSSFGKVIVNVPLINQYPELPVGCEPVCAASVLNYLGYDIDKVTFTQSYLRWDDNFYYGENKISHGPDPRKVFAGDPFKWGYGCSSGVLAEAMNSFFTINNAPCTALALDEQINSADIEKLIDGGVPIIVWATKDMKPFNYRQPSEWIIDETGEEYCWYANSHTLVLCGYDNTCYYFMDCADKKEITAYLKDRFINRFGDNGSQAVVVKIDNYE